MSLRIVLTTFALLGTLTAGKNPKIICNFAFLWQVTFR